MRGEPTSPLWGGRTAQPFGWGSGRCVVHQRCGFSPAPHPHPKPVAAARTGFDLPTRGRWKWGESSALQRPSRAHCSAKRCFADTGSIRLRCGRWIPDQQRSIACRAASGMTLSTVILRLDRRIVLNSVRRQPDGPIKSDHDSVFWSLVKEIPKNLSNTFHPMIFCPCPVIERSGVHTEPSGTGPASWVVLGKRGTGGFRQLRPSLRKKGPQL